MTITLKSLVESGNLVNCTPHPINVLLDEDTLEVTVPSCGETVRADATPTDEVFEGIFDSEGFLEPVLPVASEGKFFLVSLAVSSAMKEHGIKRADVVVGGTGPRDNPRRHPEKKFVTGIRRIKFANR